MAGTVRRLANDESQFYYLKPPPRRAQPAQLEVIHDLWFGMHTSMRWFNMRSLSETHMPKW